MAETQLDYSAQGVGKSVSLIFPAKYKENNPGITAKELMEMVDKLYAVGHMWWEEIKILKFFWFSWLDTAKVDRALSVFREKYRVKIYFFEGRNADQKI